MYSSKDVPKLILKHYLPALSHLLWLPPKCKSYHYEHISPSAHGTEGQFLTSSGLACNGGIWSHMLWSASHNTANATFTRCLRRGPINPVPCPLPFFFSLREKATSTACGARLQPRSHAAASEITIASLTVSEAAGAINAPVEVFDRCCRRKLKRQRALPHGTYAELR